MDVRCCQPSVSSQPPRTARPGRRVAWPALYLLAMGLATAAQADEAFDLLFSAEKIEAPDRGRLAFYLRLDPLTWG